MYNMHDIANTRSNILNKKDGLRRGDAQEYMAANMYIKPDFTTGFNMRQPTPANNVQKENARIHQQKGT
jgi:hypothetical protein